MTRPDFKKIKVQDVELGMYVRLPLAWYDHPFITNQFLLKIQEDLSTIRALGVAEIEYDPSRSSSITVTNPPESSPPQNNDPVVKKQQEVTRDLIATIKDQQIPPVEKAQIVQKHSFTMMRQLLDNPTAESIREAKKGITAIVSMILNDDDTLHYLMDITSHDYYTYTHSVDVGVLSVALAKSLFKGSQVHDLHALGAGFFLHDLGKVKIDQTIINKPGRLTDEEMSEMRKHPILGYKLLFETQQLTQESKAIVLEHHEWMDGSGYPKGLSHQQIHLYGRICAIADVYGALTTDRPYRSKMKPFDALKLMQEEVPHHFQKDLFEQFVLLFKVI